MHSRKEQKPSAERGNLLCFERRLRAHGGGVKAKWGGVKNSEIASRAPLEQRCYRITVPRKLALAFRP